MMKGIISCIAINERERPSVAARVTAIYTAGEEVKIDDTVPGDDYDGDDTWYKLDNGKFLWAGGVSTRSNLGDLSDEERLHFLLSYRKVDAPGSRVIDLGTKEPADTLSMTAMVLPQESENIRVDHLSAEDFATLVCNHVQDIPAKRTNVLLYIHGYQLSSSLKIDLLEQFVLNYFSEQNNTIAKVIFMVWPAQGSADRKTVDDRSIRAGQQFTEKNLFNYLAVLSAKLGDQHKSLNLLVHSFGHQLLNGMLNPTSGGIPEEMIFKNIFLMAPDITHLAIKKGGETITNYYRDKDGKDYLYSYAKLKELGARVHVFHNKNDFLLYVSTKKFMERGFVDTVNSESVRRKLAHNYESLGNYGTSELSGLSLESGFLYYDVQEIVAKGTPGERNRFPFQQPKNSVIKTIDAVWKHADYSSVNGLRTIFNAQRFPEHHRYLFTCKPVVEKVLQLLQE